MPTTFTNQATLSYNGMQLTSNIATGQLVETLSVTKTAVTDNYGYGDNITYVISIVNSGDTPYTNLTVSDDLGNFVVGTASVYPLDYVENSVRYYTNGQLQQVPAVTSTKPLDFSGITVPANGNATIIYEARTNEFTPLSTDSSVANTVTIMGTGRASAITDVAVINVKDEPDLRINKSVSPNVVVENSRVTYTFTIQNYGNAEADAASNVSITDTFNPILTNITVENNGTPLTQSTQYSYNEGTGVFTTVPGIITVPPATYSQNPQTGVVTTVPGVSVVTVTGTIQ